MSASSGPADTTHKRPSDDVQPPPPELESSVAVQEPSGPQISPETLTSSPEEAAATQASETDHPPHQAAPAEAASSRPPTASAEDESKESEETKEPLPVAQDPVPEAVSLSTSSPPAAVPPPTLLNSQQRQARQDAEWRRIEADRDRSQENAQRMDNINKEIQQVMALSEQEKVHWKRQHDRLMAIQQRMETGTRTCAILHQSLAESTKLLKTLSTQIEDLQFTKIAAKQEAKKSKKKSSSGPGSPEPLQETGSLRQACIAQDILLRTTGQYLTEMLSRVFQSSEKQSDILWQNMRSRSSEQSAELSNAYQDQMTSRKRASNAWNAYLTATNARQKRELLGTPLEEDPYLACREYAQHMSQLSTIDARYRQSTTKQLIQLKLDDGRRIDAIQAILLDTLLAQKSVLEHTLKFTNSTIATVKAVDREADVAEFLQLSDLVHPMEKTGSSELSKRSKPSQTQSPSSAGGSSGLEGMTVFEEQPPQLDPGVVTRLYSEEVAHEGKIQRQGNIISSNWKDIWGVVSTSGFFHYFLSDGHQSQTKPTFTLPLNNCVVRLAPQIDPLALEIEIPNTSWLSLTGSPSHLYYRAIDENDLKKWVLAMQRHTHQWRGNRSTNPPSAQPER